MTDGTDAERIAELEGDNRRLRRLLDQRDAPGELRHRLRGTLALLRAVVRRSAEGGRDLSSYVAHLDDRLDAIVRAQALSDMHGGVDLRTLLADELFRYAASEGERLSLSGPEVRLQPRAGQILALAVHELAVNAIEHGALGAGEGRVDVSWSVARAEPNTPLLLSWTESGPTTNAGPGCHGFGMEVLTRMLPHDLEAETEIMPGRDGLRCMIRFPMPQHVGQITSD